MVLKLKLSLLGRCYLQIEENLEFSVRDWTADAGSIAGRDDGHVIGTSRLFCVHRLVQTPFQLTRFNDNTLERPFALIKQKVNNSKTTPANGSNSSPSGISRRNTSSTASGTHSRTGSSSLRKSRKRGRRLVRLIPKNHLGCALFIISRYRRGRMRNKMTGREIY